MKMQSGSRPVIIFAKSSLERDYLRNLLSLQSRILCFEKENICFDNLASLDPQLILLRTDMSETVWRFMLALDALKLESALLLLSSRLSGHSFCLDGSNAMLHSISNSFESKHLHEKIAEILLKNNSIWGICPHGLLLGSTPMIKSVVSKLPVLTKTSDTLLIEGEKGTGKELLARMMVQSEISNSFFIKIDCESISGGQWGFHSVLSNIFKFDNAQNKPITILLSKVDHLGLKAQSEVLLLLEKSQNKSNRNMAHRAAVRFIATSEADLAYMVRQKRFRKDLFYRLNVLPIHMPALRDRKRDIPLLMDHFVIQACVELKRSFLFPTPFLSEQLCTYSWPGNLDELKNTMHRLAVLGNEAPILEQLGLQSHKQNLHRDLYSAIGTDAFPDLLEIQSCLSTMNGGSLKSICDKFTHKTEKKILRKALEITSWNRKKAAALLHISYKSMLNKMKMYEIM